MLLRAHLGIQRIQVLAGGSMGGYQALEWVLSEPDHINSLFLIATAAAESAWGISIHTAQRMAIAADSSWQQHIPEAGLQGLKAARAIGMLTYRSYQIFEQQQTDEDPEKTDDFKASSYLIYQGEKLAKRFNAFSYWILGKAMDTHNIARGRQLSRAEVLQTITQPCLVISISSDQLCPPQEQQFLAKHIPHAQYHEITSDYGHDGFLTEVEKISVLLKPWMRSNP
jgi:homoserine O-acetyltransferase